MNIRTVLVVDDHPIVAQGISAILAGAPDFKVVGTALTAKEAVSATEALQPDIAILDLRLGDALAPDVMVRLLEERPGLKIAILTAFDDGALLEACRHRGASALLLKEASTLDLVKALRDIVEGRIVIDPRLDLARSRNTLDDAFLDQGYDRLSEREYDILLLLARGLNTKEMAAELSLMPNTVRSYTQTVLSKLQANNRVMALATARRLKLI